MVLYIDVPSDSVGLEHQKECPVDTRKDALTSKPPGRWGITTSTTKTKRTTSIIIIERRRRRQ